MKSGGTEAAVTKLGEESVGLCDITRGSFAAAHCGSGTASSTRDMLDCDSHNYEQVEVFCREFVSVKKPPRQSSYYEYNFSFNLFFILNH